MALVLAFQNRGITRDITIQDVDGLTITPGANDQVRAIIGREGEVAKLTVASNAPTAGGSTFTKGDANNENRLRLDASDLNFEPGTYTLAIDYFDNADGAEFKNVDRQVFVLEDDMGV